MITLAQFTGNQAYPQDLAGNAKFTLGILNEIFAAFPSRFRFTSGWRSKASNAAAGGVSNSFHVQALAGDFVPVNGQFTAENKSGISAILAKYSYELIIHDAGSGLHYHIEPSPKFSNNTVLPSQVATTATLSTGAILGIGFILILLLD